MKYIIGLIAFASLWSSNVSAYVNCTNVQVKIGTATNAYFHNFNEVGITGSVLFLKVPSANCVNSTGEDMASTIYLVIDDIDNSRGLKKLWSSMLLSAEARNKAITFNAEDKGENSRGFQILKPYYLTVN